MPQIPGSGIVDGSISAEKIVAGSIVAGIVNGTVIEGGSLIAYGQAGANTGQILVYNGQPTTGNLIGSWSGAAGTDQFGNSFPLGLSVTTTSIEGTDFIVNTSGIFYYNGTPALGNPPILSIVTSGITADPFGNTVAALLNIGNFAGAHVSYDIMGNGFLYDPTDTRRIVLSNGSTTFSGITDPSIIFYNSFGAVVLVVDQVAGGIFQYEDLGSSSQGALILAQSGKTTTDPVTSASLSAGVTLANASGNQLTQITSSNGRIRFNNTFGAAVSVIAPDIGGIFFYQDLGSASQGGAIGALIWSLSAVLDPITSTRTFSPGTTSYDPIAAGFLYYEPGNLFLGNQASMLSVATMAHISGISQPSGNSNRLYTGIYGPTSAFSPGSSGAHAVLHVSGTSPDGTKGAQLLIGPATGTADPTPATATFMEVQGTMALQNATAPATTSGYASPFAIGGNLAVVNGLAGDGQTYDTQVFHLITSPNQTISATVFPNSVTGASVSLGIAQYRFRCVVNCTTTNAAGTPQLEFTFPSASGTMMQTYTPLITAGNAQSNQSGFSAVTSLSLAAGPTLNGHGFICVWEGVITPTASGTLQLGAITSNGADTYVVSTVWLDLYPVN